MRNTPPGPWAYFVAKADTFMVKTEAHALQGVKPGGIIIRLGAGMHLVFCETGHYVVT